MEDHSLVLVTVLETKDGFALNLATSTLENAGIQYVVSGDDPRYFPICDGVVGAPGIGQIPLWNCSCQIRVAQESEAEARALLEPLQNPIPADSSGAS